MQILISEQDVIFHIKQLPLPPMIKVQGVAFEPGGAILLDGAIDLPIGGMDAKLKLVAKVSDPRTIRLRIIDVKAMGFGIEGLVKEIIKRQIAFMALPGVRFMDTAEDDYIEFQLPVDFVLLHEISTENNMLVLSLAGIDIKKMQAHFKAAAVKAADHSGSMAAQARLVGTAHGQASTTGIPQGAAPMHKPVGK